MTGHSVTIDEPPTRVVTLSPSAAQTMWEIGAADRVVGVSRYATYLDGAEDKVNVSGAAGPNVEKVVGAEPDLVLVPNSTHSYAPERVQQIRDAGIPVFVFGTGTSLEFVADKTELTGRLVGECDAGRARANVMRDSIDEIEAALDGEPTPVGLNYFYRFTSGENTFIGNVMEAAGLENGAANQGITGFRPINEETVVAMDPAWIVIPSGASVPDSAGFRSTTAVRKDQVVTVDANYLQQPAPRVIRAVEAIMERVHPDAYREYETGADPDDSDSGSGSDDDRDSRSDDRGSASSQAAGTTPTAGADRANRTRLRTTGNATLALSEPEGDDAIGVEIGNASAGETVTVDVAGDAVRNRTRTSGWAIERLNVTFSTGTDTTGTDTIIRIDSTNTTGVRTPVTNGSSTDPVDNASVIGYLNVSHTVGDGRISGGEIVVRTNRSIFEDRRSDGIALYRYHDETWARLNTTALGDGRFTARTPGFSTFAIVAADANASRTAATTTPTPTGSPAVTLAPTTAPEATSTPTASPARTPAGTTAQRRATPREETTGAEGPGFGLGVAVLILALLTALIARRSD